MSRNRHLEPGPSPPSPGGDPAPHPPEGADAHTWELLGRLAPPPPAVGVPDAADLLAGWREFQQSLPALPAAGAGSDSRRTPPRALAAALVAGLLLTGGWLLGRGSVPAAEPLQSGFAELATGSGDLATARLSDGTLVRVAPGSLVRFGETTRSRDVWLEGQAFFAVAPDKDRPFRVRSSAGEAEALGTRFEVRALDNEVRLIVVDGRVALSSGGTRVEVGPGEMRGVRDGTLSAPSPVPDLYGALGWMGQALIFQNTGLDAVARELEGRYGIPVQLADPGMEERTVTAWFTDQDFEHVFTVICRAVDAVCSLTPEGAVMEP